MQLARARSRSKSLSRRRSFSITAECNYKGARNCSPGAAPFAAEIAKRTAMAPFCKISSRQMDP